MVLQTERYPGGYQQQSYSAYQGPRDSYSSYQDVTEYTTLYSGYPRNSSYPSSHALNHQPGWSTGGDYYGNGAGHYPGGGMVAPVKPTTGGYGSSRYESSQSYVSQPNHGIPHYQGHESPPHHQGYGGIHGQSHGSPHGQGHGSLPQHHDHGNSHGNTHGYGGGITSQINKLTHGHGHNTYASGSPSYGHSPNYGHSPSGMNHGQKPSWILKGLDDDE